MPEELDLSQPVAHLLDRLKQIQATPASHEYEEMIHAGETGSGAYFIYEKVRTAVEYREQHLFLRNAIERFLNRKLRFTRHAGDLGTELIIELTKTRYLKNDTIPKSVGAEITALLHDYLALVSHVEHKHREAALSNMVAIASYDIERRLIPHPRDEAIVDFTFASMRARVDVSRLQDYHEDTFNITLYAAVQRALMKSDLPIIRYSLFILYFPHWRDSAETIKETATKFTEFNQIFDEHTHGAFSNRVTRLIKKNIAPFLVLKQVILGATDPERVLQNRSTLVDHINRVCADEYQKSSERLFGSILRSIIFIFITKMILAFALEAPYDEVTLGHIAYEPLFINLAFPPLYMLVIGIGIKVPGRQNTEKIIREIQALVYPTEQQPPLKIATRTSNVTGLSVAFNFFYLITFVVTFGILIKILSLLHYNLVEGVVFFIFFSTVNFFGFRISQAAKELTVVDEKRSGFDLLMDFITTPFIVVGQWLSDRYSRINVVTFILDFLIEMPFKTILDIFEQWNGFIRDKKDELL